MRSRLPVLKPFEVIKILKFLGYVEVRQRGSHKQFRHPGGCATTVPDHTGMDISPVLLRLIISDVGLTPKNL